MKTILGPVLFGTFLATGAFADGVTHHVAVHVDQNDPQVMNMALNNVANLTNYYESQGLSLINN